MKTLRNDAIRIWRAGVDAVDPQKLVARQFRRVGNDLLIADVPIRLAPQARVKIVGAGKAGRRMLTGCLQGVHNSAPCHIVSGWLNIPDDEGPDVAEPVRLCKARPAGRNEPTEIAVDGTREILRHLKHMDPHDVCVVLLSGGGSALLCCPVPGISLQDKILVTRALSQCGAPIQDLNCVRTQLSQVKGGKLVAGCPARTVVSLILSDVIGDPLDVIASGPTVAAGTTAREALQVLDRYDLLKPGRVPESVIRVLHMQVARDSVSGIAEPPQRSELVHNRIVGNNQTAVAAAAAEAGRLGYEVLCLGSDHAGEASNEGKLLFRRMQQEAAARKAGQPLCVLSGGEPTVTLTPSDVPRRGGRNQELVLAAIAHNPAPDSWTGLCLLSGGTDGEDGPTDAAGAVSDQLLLEDMQKLGIDPREYLRINNSWPFFRQLHGLLRTGPTQTNVMDLRVGLIAAGRHETTSDQ